MRSVTGAGVVVIGARSGIGAALARRFGAGGARVVLNDLNPEAVKALAACAADDIRVTLAARTGLRLTNA